MEALQEGLGEAYMQGRTEVQDPIGRIKPELRTSSCPFVSSAQRPDEQPIGWDKRISRNLGSQLMIVGRMVTIRGFVFFFTRIEHAKAPWTRGLRSVQVVSHDEPDRLTRDRYIHAPPLWALMQPLASKAFSIFATAAIAGKLFIFTFNQCTSPQQASSKRLRLVCSARVPIASTSYEIVAQSGSS